MNPLEDIAAARVVVTLGAGGVGKTSIAAAVGLREAINGRRVMVVTIDPARRLANALGLAEIGGTPRSIDLAALGHHGSGALSIMMLDSREVFTAMVRRHSDGSESQTAILYNRFFRRFTTAMSGTQEHAAVEQLYDLATDSRWDLIVLDTPPSRHALEFLAAPRRLVNFLDDSVLTWLVKPAQNGMKVMSVGSRYIAKMLSFFAGAEMLADLAEFLTLMATQLSGLRRRAAEVETLLKQASTVYFIIGSPERHGVEGAMLFERALRKGGYHIGAVVCNRVRQRYPHHTTTGDLDELLRDAVPSIHPSLGFDAKLLAAYDRHQQRAYIHQQVVTELSDQLDGRYPLLVVPAFMEEVGDLRGIDRLGKALYHAAEEEAGG